MAAGRQECAVQGADGAPDDPVKPDTPLPERLGEARFDGPTARGIALPAPIIAR